MAKPRAPKSPKVGVDSVKRSNAPVVAGVAVVLVLLLAVAVVLAKPWQKDDDSSDAAPYQSVTVTGAPLPAEYADANQSQLNEATGAQAPELHGRNFTGSPVDITADGKPKVIIFYAHWCPHCQKELPLISKWLKVNQSKYPVSFYAVATGTDPTRPNFPPAPWFKKNDYPTPVLTDDRSSSAATAYGLGSYPYLVFLDGQDKVITRTSGEISITDFENLVKRTASGAAATTTTTTATSTPTK